MERAGVGFMMTTNMYNRLKGYNQIHGRIMSITIEKKEHDIILVNAHAGQNMISKPGGANQQEGEAERNNRELEK